MPVAMPMQVPMQMRPMQPMVQGQPQPPMPMQPVTQVPIQQPQSQLGLPAAGQILKVDDKDKDVY